MNFETNESELNLAGTKSNDTLADLSGTDSLQEQSFEEALKALETVVSGLQRSDLTLRESMRLFQRGTKLVDYCREELDKAQQEVKILLRDNGQDEEADFPSLEG